MGVIISVLTTIILLLVVIILFIVARNKRSRRSDVLGTLQHNLHSDVLGMGIDKRMNSNIKVRLFYCMFFFLEYLRHNL